MASGRQYNGAYEGACLDRVAFPMGGMGAGMICLEGRGALSHVSLRHRPEIFNEPSLFAAVCVKGVANGARLLDGPVPGWKVFFPYGAKGGGNGSGDKNFGLPRFRRASFSARFPFGCVELSDQDMPIEATVTGWSPFVPGDADSASLPVAGLEYALTNRSDAPVEAVFSFHAENFMACGDGPRGVGRLPDGFTLWQAGTEDEPWNEGAFSACVDAADARVNCAWFRGGWFDPVTLVWKSVRDGAAPEHAPLTGGDPSPGGSLYAPVALQPGETRTLRVRLAWYVPKSNVRTVPESGCACACGVDKPAYAPWYAARFDSLEAVADYWRSEYDALRRRTGAFTECLYASTLPDEAMEAVTANLTILKSPTVLRQQDGRLWCWEGCCDERGCCSGTCTHVWNYAQALPHLFPELERGLRQTEFNENQDDRGHQSFRACLPIRPAPHDFHAAADGQLGGILKVYRDWRISGDADWLRALWPKVKASLDYCIDTWDPRHRGVLEEPHHNTYDIEFWGPDGMCCSFYVGALRAAALMGRALDDPQPRYEELCEKGRAALEGELFNGEYFIQKVVWQGLNAGDPATFKSLGVLGKYSPEAVELLKREGPKYQYGDGCLADGVIGAWMAFVCGLEEDILDPAKVRSHLLALARHNVRRDLSLHANPQRPTYALGAEGGLVLCTWPRGGELTLPFGYCSEVFTGVEYQVASHLIHNGCVPEGLEIVRLARDRYDGRVRNPFNEYECGHWYARALSSYALLQALGGARYDAVTKTLALRPTLPGDFSVFLATATGFGLTGLRDGEPFLEVRQGRIDVEEILYQACAT